MHEFAADHEHRRELQGDAHDAGASLAPTPGRSTQREPGDDAGSASYASPRWWPAGTQIDADGSGGDDPGEVSMQADEQTFEVGGEDPDVDSIEGDDDDDGDHDHDDDGDAAPRMLAAASSSAQTSAPAKEGCGCGTCDTCDAKKKVASGAATSDAPSGGAVGSETLLARAGGGGGGGAASGKSVWHSESRKEMKKSVPIDKGGDKWEVIYSVELDDVPADKLAARGEVQLTKCQQSDVDKKECKRVTPFTPSYKTKIILASSKTATTGDPVTDAGKAMSCNDTEHHCATAVPQKSRTNPGGKKFVNLVVAAGTSSSKVNSKDTMHVDKDHGSLQVSQWSGALQSDTKKGKRKGKKHGAQSGKRKDYVTLQAEISVQPGDIVEADATIKVKAIPAPGRPKGDAGKPAGCNGARNPLISHQIFVSKKKDALKSKIDSLTSQNGINCALGKTQTYRKSGSALLSNKVPNKVYVSVVSWGGRSCSAPGDAWQVLKGSSLKVTRRRG